MDLSTNDLMVWLIPAIFSIGFMYLSFKPKRNFDVWLFIVLISTIPFLNMISTFFGFLFVAFVKLEDYIE